MKNSLLSRIAAGIPTLTFIFGVIFFSIIYGMVAMHHKLFPYKTIENAFQLPNVLFPTWKGIFWEFSHTDATQTVATFKPEKMQPGLTKVVDVEGDFSLAVKVIDGQGKEFQHWNVEWQNIWPEAPDYLHNAPDLPKARPGTHIHGAQILDNGDVVFNFEHLSLVRLDPCGQVVWKLPFRTHHSVFVDEDKNIWVSAQINHTEPMPEYPFMKPNFIEPVILKVSPDGKILEHKSVFDLMKQNNLPGMLYTTTVVNFQPIQSDDILHMNDVEVFPSSMQAGFFKPGDIMISLRNVNGVFVFDSAWHLKYKWIGEFVRQHDPDFIDGNTISVLDNNNVARREENAKSRVLIKNVLTDATKVAFEGTKERPFFTYVMGKHQWLNNGNLLISESTYGRALEISPQGETVWEFNNLVDTGWVAVLEEVERLPQSYDAAFFSKARARCEVGHNTKTK